MGKDITPADLNKRNAHIQSWETVIGAADEVQTIFGTGGELFKSVGRLKIHFSNNGNVIRVNAHQENPNPTFVMGDSVQAVATYVVGDVMGYNLRNYELAGDQNIDSLLTITEGQQASGSLQEGDEALEFNWQRKAGVTTGPEMLRLRLSPVVREFDNEEGFRTEFGYSTEQFVAKNRLEPEELNRGVDGSEDDQLWYNYIFLISILLLAILVFIIGLQNVIKGKVEKKRALFVFLIILAATYGWRSIYFMYSYNPFLNNIGMFAVTANTLLFSLVLALYGALAYISWEALARSQNQKQVDVIDALWRRKFFVSETGAALVHGFAIGGIAIGLFSVLVYLSGEFMYQSDSQFGYAEASIPLRLFTINLSTWNNALVVVVAQIGFVYGILNHWIKKNWLAALIAIVLIGFFDTVLGRMIGVSGGAGIHYVLYTGLAIIFVYAIKEYGLVTVLTAFWLFSAFFMIQPYLTAPKTEIAYVAWVELGVMLIPLIYGFVAYRFGISVSEVGEYTPEYEERRANHLRVEREIEIARESQYKLMPLQPPKADGIDVYGFFLPSFEVGGDYFDYVLSEGENGKPEALTMAVVDVSGKAMRAAMPAIFTSGLLLSRMKEDKPAKILSQVTAPIFFRTDKRTFITCALARYELESRKISIANAGHCKPILKRNGVAEFVHNSDPKYPLGIREKVEYQDQEIILKKGDFFFMYSDGLPEAENEQGERFGFEEVPRLIESIDTETLSANEIAQEIKRTIQKFSNYQLVDDTTIICLKV